MAKKYEIAGEQFSTKKQITERCQRVLHGGSPVAPADQAFLVDLFSYHHHWESEKVGCGVARVEIRPTVYDQIGFFLVRHDGSEIDISFYKAIKDIPSGRKQMPQSVADFKAAAREEVVYQIRDFRDANFTSGLVCPISGEPITRDNLHIDHTPPRTFDRLLFDFCHEYGVNPARTAVVSVGGIVPQIEDRDLAADWDLYHLLQSELRLTTAAGNLSVGQVRLPWEELYAAND